MNNSKSLVILFNSLFYSYNSRFPKKSQPAVISLTIFTQNNKKSQPTPPSLSTDQIPIALFQTRSIVKQPPPEQPPINHRQGQTLLRKVSLHIIFLLLLVQLGFVESSLSGLNYNLIIVISILF